MSVLISVVYICIGCRTGLDLYKSSSMTNTTWRCTWSANEHQCRLTVGGFYDPLPLQSNWFEMAINVVAPLQKCTNTFFPSF